MMDALVELPTGRLITMHVKLAHMLTKKEEDHKKVCAPIKQAIGMLEGALTVKMDEENVPMVSTDTHTAYFSHPSKALVVNRKEFLDWVFANYAQDVLTNHVSLDAIRERDIVPPGIRVDKIRKLYIRKK